MGEVAGGNIGAYIFVIVFQLGLFVLLFVSAVAISDKMSRRAWRRPFLILNSATQKLYNQYEDQRQKMVWAIGVAFAVNVLAALFLNPIAPYIFHLFEKVFAFFV